jgi:hypothetical protein
MKLDRFDNLYYLLKRLHFKINKFLKLKIFKMADFSVSGRMVVKTLRQQFKENFNGTLRVYNGNKFADDSSTLASIRKGDAKGGELTITGRMHVGTFEDKFKDTFGIKVQVANAKDDKLADNKSSLANIA